MDVFEITWINQDIEGPVQYWGHCFRILAEDEEEASLLGERLLNHHKPNSQKVVRFVKKRKDSIDIQRRCSNHVAKAYCDYCGYMSPWYGQYGISYNPNFLKAKRLREAVST